MKYLIVTVLAALAAFAVAGCSGGGGGGGGEEAPAYIGTWVNAANNGNGGAPPGKMVFTANSVAGYVNDTDTTPLGTSTWTKADEWTSGGEYYFKGQADDGTNRSYALIRLSSDKNTLEVNSSTTDYPTSFTGEPESIFTRQ